MTAIAAQPVPADAVQPDLDVQSAVVLRIVTLDLADFGRNPNARIEEILAGC